MSVDTKIYVDAGRPATLNDGAGNLTDCATLQEAVLAWHTLPSAQKIRATVKMTTFTTGWLMRHQSQKASHLLGR